MSHCCATIRPLNFVDFYLVNTCIVVLSEISSILIAIIRVRVLVLDLDLNPDRGLISYLRMRFLAHCMTAPSDNIDLAWH